MHVELGLVDHRDLLRVALRVRGANGKQCKKYGCASGAPPLNHHAGYSREERWEGRIGAGVYSFIRV